MFTLLDIRFYTGSMDNLLRVILEWIRKNEHRYICVTGVHGIVESNRNRQILLAHHDAGQCVPDGMPLVWVGRFLGNHETTRIYGPDLLLSLCAEAELRGYTVYFYGTTPETLQKLTVNIKRKFPRLCIAGFCAPPFRRLSSKEENDTRRRINQSGAHILFVGLSTPKQEVWMWENTPKLKANIAVGVGAAFDFIAGTRRQAPRFVQRAGMEWLFRLCQEPGRLWKRYLHNNSLFIFLIIKTFFLTLRKQYNMHHSRQRIALRRPST